jgi:hypothetical protein
MHIVGKCCTFVCQQINPAVKHLFIMLLFISVVQVHAQRRRAVYAEFLGNGLVYTLNYDQRFGDRSNGFGFRFGANLLTGDAQQYAMFLPMHLNLVLGSTHALELGAGVTVSPQFGSDPELFVIPSGAIQYRYQGERGLLIRAGLTPSITPTSSSDIIPGRIFWFWPGFSVGFRF